MRYDRIIIMLFVRSFNILSYSRYSNSQLGLAVDGSVRAEIQVKS